MLTLTATAMAEAFSSHMVLQREKPVSVWVTDHELHRLKREFGPLLDAVNELYDSPFISNEYLDGLGLGDFLEERKLVNVRQYFNNSHQK